MICLPLPFTTLREQIEAAEEQISSMMIQFDPAQGLDKKFTCILLQNHPEEKKEYLLAVKRPRIIEKQLPSACKPTHILLQKLQFHALMTNFCVCNEHKVQR